MKSVTVFRAETSHSLCFFSEADTMRLVILDDYELASEWAAKYIRNRIIQFQPSADRYFTLGLPTGEHQHRSVSERTIHVSFPTLTSLMYVKVSHVF